MPELPTKDLVIFPLVVLRRITQKGAEFVDIKLLSQWSDRWIYSDFDKPREQWNFYDILSGACDDIAYNFWDPEDPFELSSGEETLITNVYILKIEGQDAGLFKAVTDVLEESCADELLGWLTKLAALTAKADSHKSGIPIQAMIESLVKQTLELNIPKVIPLGKSEMNPN